MLKLQSSELWLAARAITTVIHPNMNIIIASVLNLCIGLLFSKEFVSNWGSSFMKLEILANQKAAN